MKRVTSSTRYCNAGPNVWQRRHPECVREAVPFQDGAALLLQPGKAMEPFIVHRIAVKLVVDDFVQLRLKDPDPAAESSVL